MWTRVTHGESPRTETSGLTSKQISITGCVECASDGVSCPHSGEIRLAAAQSLPTPYFPPAGRAERLGFESWLGSSLAAGGGCTGADGAVSGERWRPRQSKELAEAGALSLPGGRQRGGLLTGRPDQRLKDLENYSKGFSF